MPSLVFSQKHLAKRPNRDRSWTQLYIIRAAGIAYKAFGSGDHQTTGRTNLSNVGLAKKTFTPLTSQMGGVWASGGSRLKGP